MLRITAIFPYLALLLGSVGQIAMAGSDSITGHWVDNFNVEIELVQNGSRVSGSAFTRGAGGGNIVIKGTRKGDRIEITLSPDFGNKGKAELKVTDGAVRLTGKVRRAGYPASWSSWQLSKLGPYGEILAPPTVADQQPSDNNRNASIDETPEKEVESGDPDELIPVSSGSGFAVSRDGHIVTNNHVIEGCRHVVLHHQGDAIESRIVYRDPVNDLAVLQAEIEPARVFSISRRNPQLMQEIFVAGYPFGLQLSSSIKVTKGIVSSLSGLGNNVSNIQIDAALQPGNSGGPIFDDKGNVIGVAVAKLDLVKIIENFGVVPENTNFGVKSNVVVNLLESNGIEVNEASEASLSNAELGEVMSNATFHLSCWMTRAEAREIAESKVLYRDADE